MTYYIRAVAIMFVFSGLVWSAFAGDDLSVSVPDIAPENMHYEHPDTDMPFISINTDMWRDLNWGAALEFSDPALRPTPVTLPLLENYPFDNLEIKLRVLNVKF